MKEINKEQLIKIRQDLHQIPEIGFDLDKTYDYIFNKLIEYGYEPIKCGRKGIIALAGNNKTDKVLLLRADMDALPIKEETSLSFKATNGNMHACGHDMHSSMLLEAARILKKNEEKLNGIVKFMFEPAEEMLKGALDMISDGLLDNPKPTAAIMIHVSTNTSMKTGSIFLAPKEVTSTSCDNFSIRIIGKSAHASSPNKGIDPLVPLAHIILALNEIRSKELGINDSLSISLGMIDGGTTNNVIPKEVILKGTIRAYEDSIRIYAKNRLVSIVRSISRAFRTKSKIDFTSFCPSLKIDEDLYDFTKKVLKRTMKDKLILVDSISNSESGSEDFAFVTKEVPSVMISLSAGSIEEGYIYPIHHPKVVFNEEALAIGVESLLKIAFDYLK